MASNTPSDKSPFHLPHPPPLLHTRSGNETYNRPSTPVENDFLSPTQTPQGSPSKNMLPPGALNLPGIFDKALKLTPSSPVRSSVNTPHSPGKGGLSVLEDFNESVLHRDTQPSPGSPTHRSNKENAPPIPRLGKDLGLNTNPAAVSRYGQYQSRENEGSRRPQSILRSQNQLRGLTPEELEKLQQPRVKRLTNVTQLCTGHFLDVVSIRAASN
jgi:cell cycle protein kinase DBF2